MKIGAQLYTLRGHLKTAEAIDHTFEKLRDLGFSAVQVSAVPKEIAPETVAELAGKYDLTIAATHMGWRDFTDNTGEVIRIHKLWKCQHSAVGILPKSQNYYTAEGPQSFIDELKPVVERLKQANLTFSYHNHAIEMIRCGNDTWLGELYDQTSADDLKAEIDVYWISVGGGEPSAWIRRVGKRQPLVHAKDFLYMPDGTTRFAPVGKGNLNWEGILQACSDVEAEWILIEQDNCYEDDPFDCLKYSLDFLNERIGGG